jgi:hypothetical protein
MDEYEKTLSVLKRLIKEEFKPEIVIMTGMAFVLALGSIADGQYGLSLVLGFLAFLLIRRIYFWK